MSQTPTRRWAAAALNSAAHALARLATAVQPPRTVLVLGGARSGKSQHAERLMADYSQVCYIATGLSPDGSDPEWAERVALHRARRPAHWYTVQTLDLATALAEARSPVLIDCLATWLARILDEAGAWDDVRGWQRHVEERIGALFDAWQSAPVPIVAVSNEVGSGVVPATHAGRTFRDALGSLNSRLADASESVRFVVAGQAIELARHQQSGSRNE